MLLTSSVPSVVSVPPSVKVSPNATVQALTVSTAPVTGPVEAVITASYGGVVRRAKVIVARENSVTVQALTIEPARVTGGTIASGTVTLNEPAPFGGATVVLETHRRTMITMPATVLVPEGATSAGFAIGTEPLHGPKDRGVEITATYNGVTAGATLTIAPTNVTSTSTRAPVLCASAVIEPCLTRTALDIAANAVTAFEQQYSLYTPELNLLAETAAAPAGSPPPVAYEYIWFGGQPVAQIDVAANEILYTYTDHLGTPILQTDASARVVWRVEYEPYGNVHAFRRGEARHQPLRFPGQESDGQELSYNIFRWYRSSWGTYTQADRAGLSRALNLYSYVKANPIAAIDPNGLYPVRFVGKPNAAVQIDCRSATALGCTFVDRSDPECKCSPACDRKTRRSVWVAHPNLTVRGLIVEFSTDCYDTGKIILEELRHVEDITQALESIEERAQYLSHQKFDTESDCRNACFLWVTTAWRDISGTSRDWIDFTHPWRRCDGSYTFLPR